MHGSVAKSTSWFFVGFGILFGSLLATFIVVPHVLAQTSIGATICQASSSVSFTTPLSDSVVTAATVPLAGTVNQANQIQIYVDDVFDSIIPLSIGQTTFSGSVQLTPGTHTIKAVAQTTCPGANGTASAVVTYTPPTQGTPSAGSTTPTVVNNSQTGGSVRVSTSGETLPTSSSSVLMPQVLVAPFQGVLGWLNINVGDSGEAHSLSLWRAMAIGVGLYLVIFGIAAIIIQMVASLPGVALFLPTQTASGRIKWVSWGFRGVGLLIVVAALLL